MGSIARTISSGVLKESILRSTVWNITYDPILRLELLRARGQLDSLSLRPNPTERIIKWVEKLMMFNFGGSSIESRNAFKWLDFMIGRGGKIAQ